MAAELFQPDLGEQLRSRNRAGRLAHNQPAGGEGGEIGQPFAPPFGQDRAAANAVGHVAAHQCADFLQLLLRHIRHVKPPQNPQYRRSIAAAASHAGADGDVLLDVDGKSLRLHSDRREKPQGRLGGNVSVAFWKIWQVRCYHNFLSGTGGNCHMVRQINGLHDHPHLVVAVRTLAQNIQCQIQFCVGRFRTDHNDLPLTAIFPRSGGRLSRYSFPSACGSGGSG